MNWLIKTASFWEKDPIEADPAEMGYKEEWGEHHGPVKFVPDNWNYGPKGYVSPPIPLPKRLYHATPYADKILEQGFILPKDLGKQTFGGGDEFLSFTSLDNARKYQEVIRDLVRVANGEFDNMDLWSAFQYMGDKWNIPEDTLQRAYQMIAGWQKDDQFSSTSLGLLKFFGYIHNFEGGKHVPFIFGGNEKTIANLRGLDPNEVGIIEVETKPLQWHNGANIFNDTDMSKNYTYNRYENEWRIYDPNNIVPIRRVA